MLSMCFLVYTILCQVIRDDVIYHNIYEEISAVINIAETLFHIHYLITDNSVSVNIVILLFETTHNSKAILYLVH